MAKHRKFTADRFLDKLQGHEEILVKYLAKWERLASALGDNPTVDAFKQLIESTDGPEMDEMLEGLYRAFDLCSEVGHEHLVSACEETGCKVENRDSLPVECLALLVLSDEEDAFDLAYDRYNFGAAERFSCFQGRAMAEGIDGARLADHIRFALAAQFRRSKGSERVLVRQFSDHGRLNVIIYHEKRTKAALSFKGTKHRPRVAPMVYRPAQQDLLCFDISSGRVDIEAANKKEEAAIRTAFAEACFGRKDYLEDKTALTDLKLDVLKRPGFRVSVDEGDSGAVAELHLRIGGQRGIWVIFKSTDVLETIRNRNLEDLLREGTVRRVVFKIYFRDEKPARPVELAPPNSMRFKRATHADDILRYLRNWGILDA